MRENMPLTVSQVNAYIKRLVDDSAPLTDLFVRGEISNFVNHRSGHLYFSLKDEGGLIRAVMFRSYAQNLPFLPEDGMKVILHGRVSVFVRDGQYQIYADDIQPEGVGALFVAFEQLKRKLEAEGLFDSSRKKPIPKLPSRIGIVTSPTGAAVRDMLHILKRRFPYTEVVLYPALVQGPGAAAEMADGIRYFNDTHSVETILIGRGGGSIEDLWAFNDERLARCVAASKIPVISAVGHETDFTLCDFAADLRAPTPSAAAELAVPETEDIRRRLENINVRNRHTIEARIAENRQRLRVLTRSGVLADPERLLDEKRMSALYASEKLRRFAGEICHGEKVKLSALAAKLEALNPLAILSRGYSVVTDARGQVVRSVADVQIGQRIHMEVPDGKVTATVVQTEPKAARIHESNTFSRDMESRENSEIGRPNT